jgi:hypothetical protein
VERATGMPMVQKLLADKHTTSKGEKFSVDSTSKQIRNNVYIHFHHITLRLNFQIQCVRASSSSTPNDRGYPFRFAWIEDTKIRPSPTQMGTRVRMFALFA